MKILIIQENGRHEKNRNYRECFCLQRAFKFCGCNADIWGLNHNNFKDKPNFDLYDVVFDIENYSSDWIPDMSKIKPFKIMWNIDAHIKGMKYYDLKHLKHKYNLIVHSTADHVKKDDFWFPNCFDDTLIKNMHISKIFDIGFCGNVVNRQNYLNLLANKFQLRQDIFVIGDDMVKAINSYKIHFNKNITNDINYRNFETIGCGTVLITNYNKQYEPLGFVDGINCLFYNNEQELIEKISNALQNNVLLSQIQNNTIDLAKKHTYKNRVSKLIECLKTKI